MKKYISIILILIVNHLSFSQENGITYQAVIYQPGGEQLPGQDNLSSPLANSNICIRFSIIDLAGNIEYEEVAAINTDDFGMVNLVIGTNNQTDGYVDGFGGVLWDDFDKYLRVGLDLEGGCSQFEEISYERFNYVPLAFNAKNAERVTGIVPIENGGTGAKTVGEAKINLELDKVDNTGDIDKPVSRATQAVLDLKENIGNKSLDVISDAISDVKYPSVKAVKTYIDNTANNINTLANGKVYLGDASNVAQEVTLTGDVTIDNAGVSTIGASKVLTGMIADGTIIVGDLANDAVETAKIKDANVTTAKIADANITTAKILDANVTNAKLDKTNIPLSGFGAAAADVALGANKLTGVADPTIAQDAATKNYVDIATTAINTLANGKLYLGDASNVAQEVTLTGDVTIDNAGVSAIGASTVLTGMIADGTIIVGDLANNAIETTKIKDANVTNAKLDKANIPLSGFASTTSAGLAGVISDETGTGSVVLAVSPTLTGIPAAPTATAGTNTTQIATTAFVNAANSINANLTGPITSVGNTTSVASQTGTGSTFVMNTSPTLVTPALGTPTALVGTNITGTANGLTAGNVTTNANLTGMVTSVGNATTVVTNADLTGEVTSLGNATTVTNSAVIGKVLTGYTSGAGTISATDNILQAVQKLTGNNGLKAPLSSPTLTGVPAAPTATAGTNTTQIATTAFVNAANTTNANLTGMVTSVGNATTVVTNANLSGPITSVGNTTSVVSQTGTGSTFVMSVSPTLVTPALGTPSALVGTNITGTAAGLTAGNVTTNASLTGDVISTGNATTIAANKVLTGMILDGTILVGDLANNAIETTKIKDANVTNLKLDKANIPLSGFGAAAADVALGANKLTGVKDPTLAQDAATKNYVDNVVKEVADELTATAAQTSFTLTQTPSANSKVKMFINGIRISNTAYSITGTTLTYNKPDLIANDRVQFDYFY